MRSTLLVLLLLLTACDQPAGTARSVSTAAGERASVAATAAGEASTVAAIAAGEAAALRAVADRNGTESDKIAAIKAEADAAAKAEVAKRLSAIADATQAAALQASVAARAERARDAEDAERRAFLWWARMIGLAAVAGGALIGCVVGWLVTPRLGIVVGGSLVATGVVVVAFASIVPWLPVAVLVVAVLGALYWILAHRRDMAATVAASRTIDALEQGMPADAGAAKAALAKAVQAAGRTDQLSTLRGHNRLWGGTILATHQKKDQPHG
jgi:hypothetical protein